MNNDYLRLNSKEEDEDVVEGGFASQTEKIAEEKSREPQVTFFSLFGNDGGRAFGWNKNKTRGVLTLFLGSLLFSSALFLLASLTKSVVALIAGASLMAVSVPLSSVVFFYGFNNMKNVGIFEISIGAFIGAAYFVVVELCSVRIDAVTSTGYMSENLKITLLTIGEDIVLYAIAILCAKLFKKDCVFGTMLIVVSIFGGYSVADTITKLVNGLFIDISVYGGTMSAIVADSSMIDKTLRAFFPALIKEGIVITVLMCLWSIVCGALVSVLLSPVRVKDHGNISVYSTFAAVIAMHIAVEVKYSYGPLAMLVYIAVIAVSAVLAVRLLNYSVSVTNFDAENKK